METADVVAGILNGDLDDDLTDIVAAMRERQRSGRVEFLWRIDFDGLEITEGNLTVEESIMVERVTIGPNGSRGKISEIGPAQSAQNYSAIVTAALVHRQGMQSQAALDLVGKRSIREQLLSISEYSVTNPPKDGSDPATSDGSQPST